MEPQITISEKLIKRILAGTAILSGVLMAFITFVYNIYKDCHENGVTLFSINMALIRSIIMGGVLFTVFFLSNRKNWRKIIEYDNTEKTKPQKVYNVLIRALALLLLFVVLILLMLNKFDIAQSILLICGGVCLILLVILLILKRKGK